MKRWRKDLRDDLWSMLWAFRFGGGTSTKEAVDIFAEYVEANFKPRKDRGPTRISALQKDTEASS